MGIDTEDPQLDNVLSMRDLGTLSHQWMSPIITSPPHILGNHVEEEVESMCLPEGMGAPKKYSQYQANTVGSMII